ncbi:hypothetical protein HanHA300_Chr16g0627031 [Helianthus annuus]|nr:hypothetical protein HanHA300_Chr16g0627031 [Helianthus annuus]KAJ0444751.1 hypothetical protein HanIR_Chr16g0835251 [Helianthus annuus]KAJ0461982.1 hypothetical protein HanHA89_Chr16g0678371 [Helianthus annuus]KAJ0646252.1 hypothetical protein HanOQP8_Chr16g0633031 [Helianthus annuus]
MLVLQKSFNFLLLQGPSFTHFGDLFNRYTLRTVGTPTHVDIASDKHLVKASHRINSPASLYLLL